MHRLLPWLIVLAGCAADPALQHAEQTVTLSFRVVQEASHRPRRDAASERAKELRASVKRAKRQVSDAEQTVDLWQETGAGRLGWETVAPCLAEALEALGRTMHEAGIEPPAALDQAVAMARGSSERPCRTGEDP